MWITKLYVNNAEKEEEEEEKRQKEEEEEVEEEEEEEEKGEEEEEDSCNVFYVLTSESLPSCCWSNPVHTQRDRN